MSQRTPFFLVWTLFLLFLPTASAANLSLSSWHTTGSEFWRTVYPLHTTVVDGASELYYPHASTYLTAKYENQLSPKQSLFIEGGVITDSTPNLGTDSDWDTSKSSNLSYYGQFKTKEKGYFITVDWKHQINPHTVISYGYTYHHHHYSMTDGLYSIRNYTPVNDSLPNLNSSYNMIYHGPHIGLSQEIPLNQRLTVIGAFSYSPLAVAQGHGWWNLRDLTFDHAGIGQLFDGNVSLRYTLAPRNIRFSLGYRYQSFKLGSSLGNMNPNTLWNKTSNTTKGYFFTGENKF